MVVARTSADRSGSAELQRIVAWAIGAVLVLVILVFIVGQLSSDQGVMGDLIDRILDVRGWIGGGE